MSSAGRAPHPAFVEEYDEDAEVTLPDTRQDASVSTRTPGINTRPDSRYESSELSIIIHDDDLLSDVSGPGRSPPVQGIYEDTVLTTSNQSRRPLSIASEVEPVRIHARRRPTETRPYLNPRSEYSSFVSSPTGPVVGPSHAGNWNTASYPKIPRLRNTTGGNGSLRAQGTADAPHRRRHRRRRFPSYEPQSYRPPSYVPSQPYEYPGYTTYYPSDYLTPYAAQNPFAPAPLFGSPYRTPYYHPNQGIGLQSHGAEVSTSAGGPSRASEQPSETGPGPQTERPGTRPVHRFINLRRLKTDLEDKHAGITTMPWRAVTREFPLNIPGKPQLRMERYDIVQSQLISAAGFETHNAAILTYDQTEDGDRRFETRWMHYTSDTMELRSFMTEILRLEEVPENAVPLIAALFKHLEEEYEKPFVHGRYLEPTMRRFVAGGNDKNDKEVDCSAEVVFIAFPYLSLDPLRSQPNTDRESVHPVQSLLQWQYPFVSTASRDRHQISRTARKQPDVVYVPQIWALLVNEDLVLSTGPIDIDTLRGNYVHLEKAKPPTSAPEQRQIRLIGIQGKQYSFPLNQCQSWFEFIKAFLSVLDPSSLMATLFLNDSWRSTFELVIGKESVSEVNWRDTIHKSQYGDITIRLVQKASSPESQPIPLPKPGKQGYASSLDKQLVVSPKARGGLNEANHQPQPTAPPRKYSYVPLYPPYYVGPFTPYYNTAWPLNAPIQIPDYRSPDDKQALVARPLQPSHNPSYRDSYDDMGQLVKVNDRHEKRSERYIRLTDLSGATVRIPWRIGQSWTNMYPVIALRMQFTAEHRRAFNTDDYVLDAPNGPITSINWNENVYPGISVTLRLRGKDPGEMVDDTRPLLNQMKNSFTTLSESGEDIFPACDKGAKSHTKRAIDSNSDLLTAIDGESDGRVSLFEQSPENSPIRSYSRINVFDYLICEKDDDEYLSRKGFPDITSPFRYQVRNDAWKTKETLIMDMPRASSPPSASTATSSKSDTLSSSFPTGSSATSPQPALLSDGTLSSAGKVTPPSIPTGVPTMCPLFEWGIEATHTASQLNNSTGGISNGKKKSGDGADPSVGPLLEGCDKEAFYILSSRPLERKLMDNITKSHLVQVQVEIERTKVKFLQLGSDDDSESCAPEREAWARKELVINAALHLLDSFIPVHFQKTDESWLIGKFFGAVNAIVRGSYAVTYLEYMERILSYLGKMIDRIFAGVGVAYDLYSKERSAAPELPQSLVHAFPPLVLLLCICSQLCEIQGEGDSEYETWQSLELWVEQCYDRLTHGKYELISMARTGECSRVKVFTRVDTEDIMALILKRLALMPRAKVPWQQKEKDGVGFNLLEMYRSYIAQLEFRARRNPSSDLFDEIQQLMEEIQILNLVLDQQLNVLESTLEVVSSTPCSNDLPGNSSSKISSTCIVQTQQHLNQTRHDLSQLEKVAKRAADQLRYILEVRKESHSKAITIFTIVTVIFLPLSFVTSYLGMNSVDIRDGTFTQGLFWAVAIPIATCLVGGLWLGLKFRRRIKRLFVDRLGSCTNKRKRWISTGLAGLKRAALVRFRQGFGFRSVERRARLPSLA